MRMVVRQLTPSSLYFVIGSFLGVFSGLTLFVFNKDLLDFILTVWFKRILFGTTIFGNQYTFWFVLNNIVVLLLIVVASILIMFLIMRKRKYISYDRFGIMEKQHPRITLLSLYVIPIGALMINGFLLSLFVFYVLFNYGFDKFVTSMLLLLPHGINEILALFLASSLALSYIKILSPLILARKWNSCRKVGKELLSSRVTLFIITLIAILVLFSGFIEGALTLFLIK